MEAKISLVTIWTNDIEPMKNFYNKILGFKIINDLGSYVEFKNPGVRFAICQRDVMYDFDDHYKTDTTGQSFELAFPCDSPKDVNESYEELKKRGVIFVHPPEDMPWQQRTALFKDPDDNIHEIFAELGGKVE